MCANNHSSCLISPIKKRRLIISVTLSVTRRSHTRSSTRHVMFCIWARQNQHLNLLFASTLCRDTSVTWSGGPPAFLQVFHGHNLTPSTRANIRPFVFAHYVTHMSSYFCPAGTAYPHANPKKRMRWSVTPGRKSSTASHSHGVLLSVKRSERVGFLKKRNDDFAWEVKTIPLCCSRTSLTSNHSPRLYLGAWLNQRRGGGKLLDSQQDGGVTLSKRRTVKRNG